MASGRNRKEPGTAGSESDERRIGELIPGSLASLDTTLPPTPLRKLLEADGASVHILTGDPALAEVVEEAAGHQYPVHVHAEWAELLELIEGGRCRIVLLDADLIGDGMEDGIRQLHAAGENLVVLVAAPRETAQRLIGLLSERSVHRLLIKPAAVGITRLLLESAVSRYLQLREQAPEAPGERIDPPVRRAQASEPSRLPSWIIAVALVSVLVGALAVTSIVNFGPRGTDAGNGATSSAPGVAGDAAARRAVDEPTIAVTSDPIVAPAIPTSPTAAPEPESGGNAASSPAAAAGSSAGERRDAAAVADRAAAAANGDSVPAAVQPAPAVRGGAQAGAGGSAAAPATADAGGFAAAPATADAAALAAAAEALAQGRLTSPAGDGALELFAAAVASAPADARAREGLGNALEAAFGAAETALLDENLDAAADMLEGIRGVQPESGRLNFLEAQLAAARAVEASAARTEPDAVAEPRPSAAPPSELDSLLSLARARLERGALIEPAGDSARDYLARAEAINPNDADVFFVRSDLAVAATEAARLVLDAGDVERASRLVAEARRLGAERDALVLLDLDLNAAREAAAVERQRTRLGLALNLIDQGQLIEPADGSAEFHLLALRDVNPGLAGLANAWTRLAGAETERARQALAAGDLDTADVWVAALERAAPGAETTRALRNEILVTRRQAEYLRTPARTDELVVVESGSVSYPQDALRREIEGSVLVEFVVDTMGRPTGIRIVEATEPGWFEEAAVESVAGYRYVPFELDGHVYERLARLRINFGLQ